MFSVHSTLGSVYTTHARIRAARAQCNVVTDFYEFNYSVSARSVNGPNSQFTPTQLDCPVVSCRAVLIGY